MQSPRRVTNAGREPQLALREAAPGAEVRTASDGRGRQGGISADERTRALPTAYVREGEAAGRSRSASSPWSRVRPGTSNWFCPGDERRRRITEATRPRPHRRLSDEAEWAPARALVDATWLGEFISRAVPRRSADRIPRERDGGSRLDASGLAGERPTRLPSVLVHGRTTVHRSPAAACPECGGWMER